MNRTAKKDNNGKRKLKFGLFALILMFGVSMISAAYVFGISSSNITGLITGGNEELLVLTNDFEDFELNTSESSQVNSQVLTFNNNNGNAIMQLSFDVVENITDLQCPNPEEDLTIELFNSTGGVVNDGDNVTIVSGENSFTMNTTAIHRSCAREIQAQVELTEILI